MHHITLSIIEKVSIIASLYLAKFFAFYPNIKSFAHLLQGLKSRLFQGKPIASSKATLILVGGVY